MLGLRLDHPRLASTRFEDWLKKLEVAEFLAPYFTKPVRLLQGQALPRPMRERKTLRPMAHSRVTVDTSRVTDGIPSNQSLPRRSVSQEGSGNCLRHLKPWIRTPFVS